LDYWSDVEADRLPEDDGETGITTEQKICSACNGRGYDRAGRICGTCHGVGRVSADDDDNDDDEEKKREDNEDDYDD
jgi:hypothetical protein